MSNYNNHTNLFKHPSPEDVFCKYYTQFRDDNNACLLGLSCDPDLALDTQNVFLKFWTLKDQYHSIENVRAYLMQMAKNVFIDTCRQDKNHTAYMQRVSDGAEVSKNLTEIPVDEIEQQRTFQRAIIDLSKQRRIVYVLSQIEGWRREKIAKTLGTSPFTVKVTLQNAIREVRKNALLPINFQLIK